MLILYLSIPDNGSLEDSVHAEDGWLGHVDDGGSKHRPENAAIADCEGASIHIFNSQLWTN